MVGRRKKKLSDEIWTPAERERMLDVSIAISSPPLVPTDDPNERLPMRIARRERDRLARLRLKDNTPEPQQQRPDIASALTAAEFSRARGRGRRR